MLKVLVIAVAIIVAVVNTSAQTAGSTRRSKFKAGVVRVGPATTYLKDGFSVEEVLRLLGEPSAVSEHKAGNQSVVTYEFHRGQTRVLIAEFINGALVSSRIESREHLAAR